MLESQIYKEYQTMLDNASDNRKFGVEVGVSEG